MGDWCACQRSSPRNPPALRNRTCSASSSSIQSFSASTVSPQGWKVEHLKSITGPDRSGANQGHLAATRSPASIILPELETDALRCRLLGADQDDYPARLAGIGVFPAMSSLADRHPRFASQSSNWPKRIDIAAVQRRRKPRPAPVLRDRSSQENIQSANPQGAHANHLPRAPKTHVGVRRSTDAPDSDRAHCSGCERCAGLTTLFAVFFDRNVRLHVGVKPGVVCCWVSHTPRPRPGRQGSSSETWNRKPGCFLTCSTRDGAARRTAPCSSGHGIQEIQTLIDDPLVCGAEMNRAAPRLVSRGNVPRLTARCFWLMWKRLVGS